MPSKRGNGTQTKRKHNGKPRLKEVRIFRCGALPSCLLFHCPSHDPDVHHSCHCKACSASELESWDMSPLQVHSHGTQFGLDEPFVFISICNGVLSSSIKINLHDKDGCLAVLMCHIADESYG